MFTTDCFIRKNTKELRDKLEDLGYEEYPYGYIGDENLYAESYREGWFDGMEWHVTGEIPNYDSTTDDDVKGGDYGVDCGVNEDLFLAIAALRDDSDYMQYFVTEEEQHWVNQGLSTPKGSFELCLTKERLGDRTPAHKATVSELIEHFKN